ncbi:uncharacterized protein LOC116378997 [Anarrhichthys ocellatus]|uniref:uncharacterized protein LOC116378997 n=1 Tax=Anarrhichthys ocellatus TaxID=433405 RepID=UPI0012ED1DAC|nr:uncharacterized protein LOC116378997 [Anarrhichthys ocellatus]
MSDYLSKVAWGKRDRGDVLLWSEEEIRRVKMACQDFMPSRSDSVALAAELGTGKTPKQYRDKCRGMYRATLKLDKSPRLTRSRYRGRTAPPIPPSVPLVDVKKTLDEIVASGASGGAEGSSDLLVTEEDCSQGAISSAASAMIREIGLNGKTRYSTTRRQFERPPMTGNRYSRRKAFRRQVSMLRKDGGKTLAKLVLDGQMGQQCPVPLKKVTSVFKSRWGLVRPFHGLGKFKGFGKIDNRGFCYLITSLEVYSHLRCIKNRTAPGPDGITKGALQIWDPKGVKLAHMFSTWLVSGILPKDFRHCRTSLIPKTSVVSLLSDINQWRPITIASIVLRLFSRVLTKRMTGSCPLHP